MQARKSDELVVGLLLRSDRIGLPTLQYFPSALLYSFPNTAPKKLERNSTLDIVTCPDFLMQAVNSELLLSAKLPLAPWQTTQHAGSISGDGAEKPQSPESTSRKAQIPNLRISFAALLSISAFCAPKSFVLPSIPWPASRDYSSAPLPKLVSATAQALRRKLLKMQRSSWHRRPWRRAAGRKATLRNY